jgi:hypothetical protein
MHNEWTLLKRLWLVLFILVILLLVGMRVAYAAEITDSFVDAVIQVESGNQNLKGQAGERGVGQITRAAWKDVNTLRIKEGRKTYPFSSAWDVQINRAYTKDFLRLCQTRFQARYKRNPTNEELATCFNKGFSAFTRRPRPNDYGKRVAALAAATTAFGK